MSIKSRLEKINQVANADTTREVYRRDAFHFVWHVNSVRTDEQFQVVFDWSKTNGYKTLTAELWSFNVGRHPANRRKTVCYQALGAIKKMVKSQGKIIEFSEVKPSSNNVIKINNPSGGTVWAIIKPVNPLKIYGLLDNLQSAPPDAIGDGGVRLGDFEDRVNLLRGEREMGIE